MGVNDLTVSSPAFPPGGTIPERHARDADNVSPPLEWSGVPEGTVQLAVICHDPDAPQPRGFTHWVVYDIPATADGISEGDGGRYTEGVNDFGDHGYGGPRPPAGHGPHHYYFWVYALDTTVDAGPGLSREQLLDRIDGHIILQNRLVGIFEL